jgi:hypothetical protein
MSDIFVKHFDDIHIGLVLDQQDRELFENIIRVLNNKKKIFDYKFFSLFRKYNNQLLESWSIDVYREQMKEIFEYMRTYIENDESVYIETNLQPSKSCMRQKYRLMFGK